MEVDINFFIVFGFAVFGLTYIARHTNGPGDIFLKFRIRAGKRYNLEYSRNHVGDLVEPLKVRDRTELHTFEYDPWYTKLVDCFWCFSTWISAAMLLLMKWIPVEVFYWFGAVGFAGLIYTAVEFMNNSYGGQDGKV